MLHPFGGSFLWWLLSLEQIENQTNQRNVQETLNRIIILKTYLTDVDFESYIKTSLIEIFLNFESLRGEGGLVPSS